MPPLPLPSGYHSQHGRGSPADGGNVSSGVNTGLLSNVTLRRKVNSGSWATVRQVDYAYYGTAESHGNPGDLKTAIVKDASGNALDTSYYRYYQAGDANGYAGGLKYVFSPDSYARLAADFSSPQTATDTDVAPYADQSFQYDSQHRVSSTTVQAAGSSATAGGLGTFSYTYQEKGTGTF